MFDFIFVTEKVQEKIREQQEIWERNNIHKERENMVRKQVCAHLVQT